jgi:putative addiction module component (TIGR02574 family)
MTQESTELLKKALTLPPAERAELASSLIDSLDPTTDDSAELAWQEEIARRLNALQAGTAQTVPWEEVRRKADELLHGRASAR